MRRLIENSLLQWKNKKGRKPLMLLGARQVGKTFVLQKFGKQQFQNVHYFDLEEHKDELSSVFMDSSLNPKKILEQLSFVSGKMIDVKSDLLILDEIQSIPRAITSLKYFYQDMSKLAIVVAGSNLGVSSSEEPFPVGKVEVMHLYPLNFEEFLEGSGEEQAYAFLTNFSFGKTDDLYHKKLFELLKIYFITGGLPEVVEEYKQYKDNLFVAFKKVRLLQKQLLFHYQNDFSKYSGSTNSRHIERIFGAVPAQLSSTQNQQSKKFRFKDVISKGYRRYEELADPVDWLVKAGLVFKLHTNDNPAIPLLSGIQENSFKLFLFDIGLLGAMVHLLPENIIRYDYGSYKGYFAENFVLQELWSYGYQDIVTWAGRTSEVEFVTEIDGTLVPIEVKAGTNTRAKSLIAFLDKYNPRFVVKITGNKYGYDANKSVYNYPLYMISKFPPAIDSPEDLEIIKIQKNFATEGTEKG